MCLYISIVFSLNGYPGGLAFLLSSISPACLSYGHIASVNSENLSLPSPSLSHLLKNRETSSGETCGRFRCGCSLAWVEWKAVRRSWGVMWPWLLRSTRRKASKRLKSRQLSTMSAFARFNSFYIRWCRYKASYMDASNSATSFTGTTLFFLKGEEFLTLTSLTFGTNFIFLSLLLTFYVDPS
jgi:hypothetical protein